MSFIGKHNDLARFKMANTWDKVLEYNQHSSLYYSIMVEKLGKANADYYWDRRYAYEHFRDEEAICKEIYQKCDLFLKNHNAFKQSLPETNS